MDGCAGMSGDRKAAIGGGCKWSLKQLREYTQQAGGNWDRMWERIKNVCVLTTMLLVQSVPKVPQPCGLMRARVDTEFGFDPAIRQ